VTSNVINNTTYACRSSFVDLTSKLFDDLEREGDDSLCKRRWQSTDRRDQQRLAAVLRDLFHARDGLGRARIQLNRCLDATQQPKNSSLNQNCQAFDSQFLQYRNDLNAAVVNGAVVNGLQTDVANRLGELKARVRVFMHVYTDQMLPSVPPGGIVPGP
jgi:hypothetical protein